MVILQFSNIFRKELCLYNTKLNYIKKQCPISERKISRLASFPGWYNCIHHTNHITGRTIICPLIFAEDKNTLLHKLQRIEIWRRKINDKNNERWRISWTWINGRGLHWLWVTPPETCRSPLANCHKERQLLLTAYCRRSTSYSTELH